MSLLTVIFSTASGTLRNLPAQAPPTPVSKLAHPAPVDFESEILPVFKAKCLACHNEGRAKSGVVLETPQALLKGGDDGPVVFPGRGEESLLLQVASHRSKPAMPPRDNKVAAVDLTPDELGLLKLWIDQGARGEVHHDAPIAWQLLPESFRPIFAVALSGDGQFAACSRANQIQLYRLPANCESTILADPRVSFEGRAFSRDAAHRDVVQSLAFSPDGDLLASGAYREIKIWRRERPVPVFTTPRIANEISDVALSPDGHWLARCNDGGQLAICHVPAGEVVKTVEAHAGPVRCLQFSPDGKWLLSSAATDPMLRIWEVEQLKLQTEIRLDAEITAVAWMTDSANFVAGARNGQIWICRLPSDVGQPAILLKELRATNCKITSLAALPGAVAQVVAGDADGILRIWDIVQGSVVRRMQQSTPISSVASARDGKRIASVGTDHSVILWSGSTTNEVARLQGDRSAQERVRESARSWRWATNEIAYDKATWEKAEKDRKAQLERVRKADFVLTNAEKDVEEKRKKVDGALNQRAAIEKSIENLTSSLAQAQKQLELKEQATQQALQTLKACLNPVLSEPGSAKSPPTAALNLDRTTLDETIECCVALAQAAGEAKAQFDAMAIDFKAQKKQADEQLAEAKRLVQDSEAESKKTEQGKSNGENELNLAIAAAQKSAEAASEALNAIALAEAENKQAESQLAAARRASKESELPIRTVVFSPDSAFLATAGEDHLIHTWNAETGQAVDAFPSPSPAVWALAFSAAGQMLSAGSDASVASWNLTPTWTLEETIGNGGPGSPISDRINALAFSPDGKLLASGGGEPSRSGQIQIWDAATGKLVLENTTAHSDAVLSMAFSSSGKMLASSAADRFMRILDLDTRKVVRSFEGHTHHVLGVAWKHDGRTLATAGADNVVKIWDFQTGERKKSVEGYNKEVSGICTFDGDQFLTVSGDHQVRLLNENGDEVRTYAGGTGFIYSVAASSDGKLVIAGGEASQLWIWSGWTGEQMASLGPAPIHPTQHASR